MDFDGNLFIADCGNSKIREVVKATGKIITVARTGIAGYSADNVPATSSNLNKPFGVAVDSQGNIFIADSNNNRVREVINATGNIITIAGTGTAGFVGDGSSATSANLSLPSGVAVDPAGNVYIADRANQRVREVIKATGKIVTIIGNGTGTFAGDLGQSFVSDGTRRRCDG